MTVTQTLKKMEKKFYWSIQLNKSIKAGAFQLKNYNQNKVTAQFSSWYKIMH